MRKEVPNLFWGAFMEKLVLKCHDCGKQFEVEEEEYRRVAREICSGKYPPMKLANGETTTYVRGEDGFKCPKCGGVMFLCLRNEKSQGKL